MWCQGQGQGDEDLGTVVFWWGGGTPRDCHNLQEVPKLGDKFLVGAQE